MNLARRSAITVLVDHVASAGARPPAVAAGTAWRDGDRRFEVWGASPAAVAETARTATRAEREVIVAALLRHASTGDEWAQLTVVAALAPRLSWIVACWARHPDARRDLDDMEAELLAECWAATTDPGRLPPGPRPGLAIVDRAWGRVRDRRTRNRRTEALLEPLHPDTTPRTARGTTPRTTRDTAGGVAATVPALEVLAGEVNQAVTSGILSLRSARALYLTRVSGLSTADAAAVMGIDPATVRALRSRAARRLTADRNLTAGRSLTAGRNLTAA